MMKFDLLIIGAGASGLSAAVAASKKGCGSILVVDTRDYPGGVLPQCIHEGFADGMTGPEYCEMLKKEFSDTTATLMLSSSVTEINDNKTATVCTPSGIITVKFKELILSTGCTEITAGELKIAGTRPNGVFYAGQAQEMINLMGKDIGDDAIILGCGDLGMIIARRLTLKGKKVLAVVEKNKAHGGTVRNYRQCIEKYSIPVFFNTTVSEIRGRERLTSVVLSDGREIDCRSLIVAAGLKCDTSLLWKFENLPQWIHLCGNCREIHSMVESAVRQSAVTASYVAERIRMHE